ncbi:major facilitator superfamily domain-containing protein [Staphylotrichum tortipilum]|uniref:Major facilitator superfamily domain-containing protein n=1 Tax=Staphylotrichum tortipilum TaxID=2831512 RepID=A0AAN6MTX9_9PEZI|nr:major facilitator superfamily domain-containing protein [Staphylotrichum longicolle]
MAAAVPEATATTTDRIEPDTSLVKDLEKAELTQDATDEESGTAPSPSPQPGKELQRWNESGLNMFRFFSTIYSFILMGMTDGAVGALLPYLESYYNITYTVVSLVFLAPFIGYLLAALLNNLIHHHLGQRGIAVLGPACRLVGIVPLVFHPPYPALPVIVLFTGFGNGIEDSAWNAWVGNMHRANELLGFLHGAYGLGATIGPLVATAMIAKGGLPWYRFYYIMIALDGAGAVLLVAAFWRATAAAHRAALARAAAERGAGDTEQRTTTRTVLRSPVVWLIALFLLGYVGAEVSLGGWIVTFMLRVRHAEPFIAGLVVTFFWLGLTIGRVVLGFVTGRVGEKLAITAYLLLSVALQLLYWLVPNFAASATFVALLGFFLGPLFPAAIVAATKLLPSDYHVSAIGFAAAFGGGGAALFPFAVGAIAQSKGVEVLQPIVLAILVFILVMWWMLPGGLRMGGLEKARDSGEKVGDEFRSGLRWARGKVGGKRE